MDWEAFPFPFGAKDLSSDAICQFIGSIPKITREVVGTGSYFDFVDGDWVKDKIWQAFPVLNVVGDLLFLGSIDFKNFILIIPNDSLDIQANTCLIWVCFWVPVIPSLSVSVGLDVYRDFDVSGTINV